MRLFRVAGCLFALFGAAGSAHAGVIDSTRQWPSGAELRVCFLDPMSSFPDSLALLLREATDVWSRHSGVTFEFLGPCPPDDYVEVRVSFSRPGYWALIGTDSIQAEITGPGEPSINLQKPAGHQDEEWFRALALHNFGHVLGLMHEHQSPAGNCEEEYRWEDDSGYNPTLDESGVFKSDASGRFPGIYTFLGGQANAWPRQTVDLNLRELEGDSSLFTEYDSGSIMHYAFPPHFFLAGAGSRCFATHNLTLSAGDIASIENFYSKEQAPVEVEALDSVRRELGAAGILENDLFRGQLVLRFTGFGADERDWALAEARGLLEKSLRELAIEPPEGFEEVAECTSEQPLVNCRELAEDRLGSFPAEAAAVLAAIELSGSHPEFAVRFLWVLAERGVSVGEYVLGLFFDLGLAEHPRDLDQARRLYSVAAEQDIAEALVGLAVHSYRDIQELSADRRAARYLEAAAAKEHTGAHFRLAVLYDQGVRGVPKRPEAAIHQARLAADGGHALAQLLCGLILLDGVAEENSVEEARRWLVRSASAGVVVANAALGYLDEMGYLKTEDLAQPAEPAWDSALSWFQIAAEAGHTVSQYKVATFLRDGLAGRADPVASAEWLGRAARGGHAQAQLEFGRINRDGEVIEQDFVSAHVWLNIASFRLRGEPAAEAAAERDDVTGRLSANEWARALREAADLTSPATLAREQLLSTDFRPDVKLNARGSGVVIGGSHILTNYHVIEDCPNVLALLAGRSVRLNYRPKIDAKNDLALFEVTSNLEGALHLRNFYENPLGPGGKVILAGYPLAPILNVDQGVAEPDIQSGEISRMSGVGQDSTRFQHSATTNPGHSGGPIVDEFGRLVGIAVSKLTGDDVEGIFFGIKSSTIFTFLQSRDLTLDAAPIRTTPLSGGDLRDLITEAAVQIKCQVQSAPAVAHSAGLKR